MSINTEQLKPERKPLHRFNHDNASELAKSQKGVKKPGTAYSRRKWCNKNCPFFDRCPVIMLALSQEPDEKGHRVCYVKGLSQDRQNLFRNLFEEGEEGLIKIISELYFSLILRAKSKSASYRDLKEAVETSLNMMKTLYGDKQKIEHSGTMPIQIIIENPNKTEDEPTTTNTTTTTITDTNTES